LSLRCITYLAAGAVSRTGVFFGTFLGAPSAEDTLDNFVKAKAFFEIFLGESFFRYWTIHGMPLEFQDNGLIAKHDRGVGRHVVSVAFT